MNAAVCRFFQDLRGVWSTADRASAAAWSRAVVRRAPTIIKTRSLTHADRHLSNRTCTFRTRAASVAVPGNNFGLAREIYCRGVYWPTVEFLPKQGYVILDLGANVGLYSLHAARAGATKVVAVEALTRYNDAFRAMARTNKVEDLISLRHFLVGGDTGPLTENAWREWCPTRAELPPVISIIDLMIDEKVDRVDLLKMDIEGSEYQCFTGDCSWLDRVDRVVMEVHAEWGEPERLAAVLEGAGFELFRRTASLHDVPALNATGYLYAIRR